MSDVTNISAKSSPEFRVIRKQISIFPDGIPRDLFDGVEDDQTVVFLSIGPGETHVSIINAQTRLLSSWTAVFGWSTLCDLEIAHGDKIVSMSDISMLTRALRSSLRLYGEAIDTQTFIRDAEDRMKAAISFILDKTVGDASEYDRIVLASPVWLHDVLQGCLSVRPHIDPEIQEI